MEFKLGKKVSVKGEGQETGGIDKERCQREWAGKASSGGQEVKCLR